MQQSTFRYRLGKRVASKLSGWLFLFSMFFSCSPHTMTPMTPIKKPVELKKTRIFSQQESRWAKAAFVAGHSFTKHFKKPKRN